MVSSEESWRTTGEWGGELLLELLDICQLTFTQHIKIVKPDLVSDDGDDDSACRPDGPASKRILSVVLTHT